MLQKRSEMVEIQRSCCEMNGFTDADGVDLCEAVKVLADIVDARLDIRA